MTFFLPLFLNHVVVFGVASRLFKVYKRSFAISSSDMEGDGL